MNKNIKIHESWLKFIKSEFDKEYMKNIKNSILNYKIRKNNLSKKQ